MQSYKEHLELLCETGSLKDHTKGTGWLERYEELRRKLYRFRETVQDSLQPAA